jgi:hypothetical protein
MWGNSQSLLIDVLPDTTASTVVNSQLIRIAYARPETWHFLFGVSIDECSGTVGNPGVFQARFNLTIGIGRSQITVPNFRLFLTQTLPSSGQQWWSTTGLETLPQFTPDENEVIHEIVGQDIQLNVDAILAGEVAAGTRLRCTVSAFFSPKTHVRPEWFKGGTFNGEENAGS